MKLINHNLSYESEWCSALRNLQRRNKFIRKYATTTMPTTRQFFFRIPASTTTDTHTHTQWPHWFRSRTTPIANPNQLVSYDDRTYKLRTKKNTFRFLCWRRVSCTLRLRSTTATREKKNGTRKIRSQNSQMSWMHATTSMTSEQRQQSPSDGSECLCLSAFCINTTTIQTLDRVGRFEYVMAISLSQDSLISMSFFSLSLPLSPFLSLSLTPRPPHYFCRGWKMKHLWPHSMKCVENPETKTGQNRRQFSCETHQLIGAKRSNSEEKRKPHAKRCKTMWRRVCGKSVSLGKSPTPHSCGCQWIHSRRTINIKTFQEYKRVCRVGTRMLRDDGPVSRTTWKQIGIHAPHSAYRTSRTHTHTSPAVYLLPATVFDRLFVKQERDQDDANWII